MKNTLTLLKKDYTMRLECFSKPFTVLKKPMRVGQFLLKPISGNNHIYATTPYKKQTDTPKNKIFNQNTFANEKRNSYP